MAEFEKIIGFEVTNNTNSSIVEKVCQMNYDFLLINIKNISILASVQLPRRMQIIVIIDSLDDIPLIHENVNLNKRLGYFVTKDISLLQSAIVVQEKFGLIIDVNNNEELERAAELVGKLECMIVDIKNASNIPLEFILALKQDCPGKILKKVTTSHDGITSLMTMEVGTDGLVLTTNDIQEIIELENTVQQLSKSTFDLQEVVVTAIKPAGMGSRVCIDTTSELGQDEGMLLGSTSSGGLLTCSETHFSEYINTRPFRVNAGGIHLYIWSTKDRLSYLSDLRAGDRVMVVNTNGQARCVTIGRIKIEIRPLIYIECKSENDKKINTFIQDDWHIRMFGANGRIIPSSDIKIGDKLLGYLDTPGRHMGIKINETITEF